MLSTYDPFRDRGARLGAAHDYKSAGTAIREYGFSTSGGLAPLPRHALLPRFRIVSSAGHATAYSIMTNME